MTADRTSGHVCSPEISALRIISPTQEGLFENGFFDETLDSASYWIVHKNTKGSLFLAENYSLGRAYLTMHLRKISVRLIEPLSKENLQKQVFEYRDPPLLSVILIGRSIPFYPSLHVYAM